MSKEIAAKILVRDSLIDLVSMNNRFREQVLGDDLLPLWIMDEEPTGQHARSKAANISTLLTYQNDQHKQETARLPGIIGISAETLQMGLQLNSVRNRFKESVNHYRKLYGDSIGNIEETSDELRDCLLGGLKIQHIHFVQSYRQLKLFPTAPKRIRFSWAAHHSGSIRLTPSKAIEHLRKKYMASAAIEEDIFLLEQLPKHEKVVIRRTLSPHLRANILWHRPSETVPQDKANAPQRYPKQINTPLPVFIRLQKGQPLPEFNQVKPFDPTTAAARSKRSDAKLTPINNNPYSRIFRYAE